MKKEITKRKRKKWDKRQVLPIRKFQLAKEDHPVFYIEKLKPKKGEHSPQYSVVDDRHHVIAQVWNEEAAELLLLGTLVKRIARREVLEQLKIHRKRLKDAVSGPDFIQY